MKLKTSFFSKLMRPFLLTAAFASLMITADAAGFLKLGDIQGEATDEGHKEWINILSVSQSISRPMVVDPATGQRHRAGATLGDVVCVKEMDKSTPKLMEALCTGVVIPSLELELTKTVGDGTSAAGRVTYYRYELKNVLVTSYSVSGATDDGEVPIEEFALNFEEIMVTYTEYDSKGTKKGNVEYGWKVEEGTK